MEVPSRAGKVLEFSGALPAIWERKEELKNTSCGIKSRSFIYLHACWVSKAWVTVCRLLKVDG